MTEATTQPTAQRDNLLGICHALGADIGFDPIWLRLALGALLLVNLELPFIVYGVLGLIVLASRLMVRARKPVASGQVVQLEPAARAALPANDHREHARAA